MLYNVPAAARMAPEMLPVDTLKLQSFYSELGENTYMREVVAYQVRCWLMMQVPCCRAKAWQH